jgi:regulator of sirC expression with transglutaminase-like and TPR domain
LNRRDAFSDLVAEPSAPIPLLESAATLAQYADADCRPDEVVRTVREWGERLRARVAADTSWLNRLRLLNFYFFDELGFHGSRVDDVRTDCGYLHRVIERRAGFPISLAVLYIEIGRAIGLKLFGVAFPGHFLVKLVLGDAVLFIDMFERGATLSADELRGRLRNALRGAPRYPLELYLRAASERDILARMLRNLKAIHAADGDWTAALEVQNRLIAVLPDEAQERRERAFLFDRLGCPKAAAEDLDAYLAMEPDPTDVEEIRRRLEQWRREARNLN